MTLFIPTLFTPLLFTKNIILNITIIKNIIHNSTGTKNIDIIHNILSIHTDTSHYLYWRQFLSIAHEGKIVVEAHAKY